MLCTNKDTTAHAFDAQVVAAPERSTPGIGAPRQRLTVVPNITAPAPLVPPPPIEQSNRIFNWSIGVGLAILVALLTAVLLNAGINVEVLP